MVRSDHHLQPFRSRHIHSFTESVHANVLSQGDFGDNTFLDLFDKPEKIVRPHKDTILHDVIRNILVAQFDYSTGHYPDAFQKAGVLRRPKYIPTWLRAGVFHRDRGRCQQCFKDMTGLGRPIDDLHLDHILLLAKSGSNDPTNFQLLCAPCNNGKGPKNVNRAPKFSPYWY